MTSYEYLPNLSITGYKISSQNVVYYLLNVTDHSLNNNKKNINYLNNEETLSYTLRKRYTDFKDLYVNINKLQNILLKQYRTFRYTNKYNKKCTTYNNKSYNNKENTNSSIFNSLFYCLLNEPKIIHNKHINIYNRSRDNDDNSSFISNTSTILMDNNNYDGEKYKIYQIHQNDLQNDLLNDLQNGYQTEYQNYFISYNNNDNNHLNTIIFKKLPYLPPRGIFSIFIKKETKYEIRLNQFNRILETILYNYKFLFINRFYISSLTLTLIYELIIDFIKKPPNDSNDKEYISLHEYEALSLHPKDERKRVQSLVEKKNHKIIRLNE